MDGGNMVEEKKKKRGFAAFTPEMRRAIARMGGRKSQADGVGYRFTSEDARVAGERGRKVQRDRAAIRVEKTEEN
jgi:hypothetical protein